MRKLVFAVLFLLCANIAKADCDSLLLTGLDTSTSVGAEGITLEIHGMADAIASPNVLNAIQSSGPRKCIGFAVFLWNDDTMVPLVEWTVIATKEDALFVAMKLRNNIDLAIQTLLHGSLTDISEALDHAGAIMNASPIKAPRRVVNIAGDGEDNTGETPEAARDRLRARGMIINGVVFGPAEKLADYYRKSVTGGPGSFVFKVSKPEQFIQAFSSKFRLDIVGSYELQKGRL